MEFELATFLESIWKRYISCNLETFIPFNPVIPLLEMGSYKIIKNEIQKSTQKTVLKLITAKQKKLNVQ